MSDQAINEILKKAVSLKDRMISIRRDLHRIPEPGYRETKTSKYISEILDDLMISYKGGFAETGIVADLGYDSAKKTIALRADMDALPIDERTGLEFSSEHEGWFHGCGHDMHVTCLLGALIILNGINRELPVNVKAIFQPAEEVVGGGAYKLIDEGVLKDPEVESIFGLHVDPFIKTGSIALKSGVLMASASSFVLRIIGKGGHGAKPSKSIDPIVIGANIVNAVQNITSRMTDPLKPGLISITQFTSGNTFNVIPGEAILKGTIRALDTETEKILPQKLEQVIKGVVSSFNAEYQLTIEKGVDAVINDSGLTAHVESAGRSLLGDDGVQLFTGTFGGEDFAAYLKYVKGCYFRLGCSLDPENALPAHHEGFTPDEDCLPFGSAMLAAIVKDYPV